MFFNSLMLLGIGAAVVPWVLHLLSRSRYRDVDWGAMMFLHAADGEPRQSSRLHQALLLILRSAVVALLAVALARPVLLDRRAAPARGQAVTAVILLDCSAAMNVEENGRPRMLLARGAAKEVLARHKGDRVALVLMGVRQTPAERQPTADLWDVARRIESADAGAGIVSVEDSLLQSLQTVAPRSAGPDGRALSESPASPAGASAPFIDFYVVSDGRASAWRGVDERFGEEFHRRLARAGARSRLFAVTVGSGQTQDVRVESVELRNPPAVVNQPADFDVKVRNYGPVRWAQLPLTLTAAGPDRGRWQLGEQNINLAPGASASFHVTATFKEAGTHVVSANLKGASASSDARFDMALDVREPTRVLVLTGESAGETPAGGAGAAACLRLALAPFKSAGQQGADACAVDVASVDAWSGATVLLPPPGKAGGQDSELKLSAWQVIVLADVEGLTARQAVALEQFVYDGGGLLLAPGALSSPDNYNETLYRDGAGILPASLGAATAADGSEQTELSGADLQHPIFRFLASRPDLYLSIAVGRYFPVLSRAPGARELAHYVSGDPFLVESSAGKGRVLLMTTSLGSDWTSLPLSSFYLPFVQSAVRFLAGRSELKLNLSPGQAIEAPLGPRYSTDARDAPAVAAATVTLPDGEQRPADLLYPGSQVLVRFADTEAAGVYQVRVDAGHKPLTLSFVVRPTPGESDPSPLTGEQWDRLAGLGFERLGPSDPAMEAPASADSGQRELWRAVLGAVLVLAVIEMAAGRAAAG